MTDDQKVKITITTDETKDILEAKLKSIEEQAVEKKTEAQARSNGFSYINLKGYPISTDALALIPKLDAQEKKIVCFFYTGEEIRYGAVHPESPDTQEYCKKIADKIFARYKILTISELSLLQAIKAYDNVPRILKQDTGVSVSEDELQRLQKQFNNREDLQKIITQVKVTELVSLIIASALKFDTSDIHIEAEENDAKLRLRIDGELTTVATIPKELFPKISSRIKLLSDLKINLSNVPQDGRFTIHLTKDKIDVRVSTMPTSYGESIVMRLLKSSSVGLEFETLGLRGRSFKDLEFNIQRPNGMIITTGPTGSGKTTTLYAILNKLNNDTTKIITLEDPIEYKLSGINQSQIDPRRGYNFAAGLRSVLRQDPDIVMVGEIRDLETAETAINAALTGHLMISTIHTNSAAGAIPRFLAMGVKPFLLAPAINAIMGQRLIRKLCPHCREEYIPEPQVLTRINKLLGEISPTSGDALTKEQIDKLKFYKPKGCEKCNNGYKGRIGVYEIMTMNEKVEQMILSGKVSEYEAQKIAIENGMVTMVQDGLLKASQGITSVDEVFDKTE